MKRTLRFLCVVGLAAAFVMMAVAMVLPHAHTAETVQHICWICQSKATGVAAPATAPDPAVLHLISLAAPATRRVFESQASFLFSEARAPPQI